MRELIVTSSVLIAAIVLLRFPFRRAISRRMQYALWLLVLVRLLLPFSFSGTSFSVLTLVEHTQIQQAVVPPTTQAEGTPIATIATTPSITNPKTEATPPTNPQTPTTIPWFSIWLIGALFCCLCFLLSNWHFARQLRREGVLAAEIDAPLPVYLCPQLPSPCLFGFLRPAIYLNTAATTSEDSLRHVLAHELGHYQQGDHIWSFFRVLCLSLYWFNPLVWLAAFLSRTDCELACDELALKSLDKADRLPYGHTLLSLIPLRGQVTNPLLTATTMQGSKRQLRERVSRIANQKKPLALVIFFALCLVALLCVVTFTGSKLQTTHYAPFQPVGIEDRVLSLANVPIYQAPTTEVTHSTGEEMTYKPESPSTIQVGNKMLSVFLYRTADNRIHAAYREESAPGKDFYRFASIPDGYSAHLFPMPAFLEERKDPILELRLQKNADNTLPEAAEFMTYFYYFTKSGKPQLLMETVGNGHLDSMETKAPSMYLATHGSEESILWYSYQGEIRRLDLQQLVREAYPEWRNVYIGPIQYAVQERGIDLLNATEPPVFAQSDFYIPIEGDLAQTLANGNTSMVTARRYLYLNKNSLAFYFEEEPIDHLARGVYASPAVIAAAKDLVEGYFHAAQAAHPEMQYIDWRIRSLDYVSEVVDYEVGNGLLGVKCLSYEFLTAAPEHFILAGGSYITEDHWCMPGYPASDYLVSHSYFDAKNETHHEQYLDHFGGRGIGPAPGTEAFFDLLDGIAEKALAYGRIPPPVFDENGTQVEESS